MVGAASSGGRLGSGGNGVTEAEPPPPPFGEEEDPRGEGVGEGISWLTLRLLGDESDMKDLLPLGETGERGDAE